MNNITLTAPAKINLSLDIIGKRTDGYHLLESVFQTVSIYDILNIKIDTSNNDIIITSDKPQVPCDQTNIVYKAVEKFRKYTNKNLGANIHIEKHIPSQAGLGGGSSDGAAVLKALNKLLNTGLTANQLCDIGLSIGADVPFFISGGTAFAEGIGEKLTALPVLPKLNLVIAKGQSGISTIEAYKKIDLLKNIIHPDTKGILNALKTQNIQKVCDKSLNVFEQITDIDDIEVIKKYMTKHNAMCAVMSGSGSAVFGIFSDYNTAKECCLELKSIVPFSEVCYTI